MSWNSPPLLGRRLVGTALLAVLAGAAVGCGDDTTTSAPGEPRPVTTIPTGGADVQRTSVNPWPWSVELGFNQAERVEGGQTTLYLAGQSSVGVDGAPRHAGDLGAQVELSLDNLEAVLAEAGMSLADVVRLTIYTTDVDGLFAEYGRIAGRMGAAGVQPPGSLVGVARLAYPELLVELEATAVS